MSSPRYLQLTVVEDTEVLHGKSARAMIDVDQVAGIIEVPQHPLGGKCKINLKWPSDDVVNGKGGEEVLRRNAYLVVEETYEHLSGLLTAYGVVLKGNTD